MGGKQKCDEFLGSPTLAQQKKIVEPPRNLLRILTIDSSIVDPVSYSPEVLFCEFTQLLNRRGIGDIAFCVVHSSIGVALF
jgi:hypothetical protein